MKDKYQEWIDSYTGEIYRNCKDVTKEMKEDFPELRIAKGLVLIVDDFKRYPHQWCVTPEGEIVDPTAGQWMGIMEYQEIKEDEPKPIGKCMNCGEWIFDNYKLKNFCCEDCHKANIDYLMRPLEDTWRGMVTKR